MSQKIKDPNQLSFDFSARVEEIVNLQASVLKSSPAV